MKHLSKPCAAIVLAAAAACGPAQVAPNAARSAKADDYVMSWFEQDALELCANGNEVELSPQRSQLMFDLGAAQLPGKVAFEIAVPTGESSGMIEVKVLHQLPFARTMSIVDSAELTLDVVAGGEASYGRLELDLPDDRSGTYWLVIFTADTIRTTMTIDMICSQALTIALAEEKLQRGERSWIGNEWIVTTQPRFAATATISNASDRTVSVPCAGLSWVGVNEFGTELTPQPIEEACSGKVDVAPGSTTALQVGWPKGIGKNQLQVALADGTLVRSMAAIETVDPERIGCPQAINEAAWTQYEDSVYDGSVACQEVVASLLSKTSLQMMWEDEICDGEKDPAYCRYDFDFIYRPMLYEGCHELLKEQLGGECQQQRGMMCEDGYEHECETYCEDYGFDELCEDVCSYHSYEFCVDY